ncbi:MAG: hypothetical protein HY718_02995 [Planctomycetes bacterium]|nr:hypothetical protein [Planctomycetota bacterium]
MREIVVAAASDGRETRYLLEVVQEADHWVSTLGRFSETGELESGRVAPRFYGTTVEQARRRMISVLENQYEEVRVEG